jgi:hypothetical protein
MLSTAQVRLKKFRRFLVQRLLLRGHGHTHPRHRKKDRHLDDRSEAEHGRRAGARGAGYAIVAVPRTRRWTASRGWPTRASSSV